MSLGAREDTGTTDIISATISCMAECAVIVMSKLKDLLNAKFYPNRLFNVLGLQIFRCIASRLVLGMMPHEVDEEVRFDVAEIEDKGILIVDNFLSQGEFSSIREDYFDKFNSQRDLRERRMGATQVSSIVLNAGDGENWTPIQKYLMRNGRLEKLARYFMRDPGYQIETATLQAVCRARDSDEQDYEMLLHRDHFLPVYKAWLYIEDVTEKNGPFVYQPRSCHLTLNRVHHEYWDSIGILKPKHLTDGNLEWRIPPKTIQRVGYEPIPVTCRANTLVFSNNYGFHARGNMDRGAVRRAIEFSFRDYFQRTWCSRLYK